MKQLHARQHRIVNWQCCCFTNLVLMWIVIGSLGSVHRLSACMRVDWSRRKLITIIHWSNWPSPDHRVGTDRLVQGSIWSEEVGAERRDAEEGGGMFSNVADQSGWTAPFQGVFSPTYYIQNGDRVSVAAKLHFTSCCVLLREEFRRGRCFRVTGPSQNAWWPLKQSVSQAEHRQASTNVIG